MATLNIKDFPTVLHRKLKQRARAEHRSLAQEVIHLLSQVLEGDKPVSLLELQGLGKEVWAGTNAVEHVDDERKSWD